MANPPVPDVVQVEFRTTLMGQETENRIYVDLDETPTLPLLITLGADLLSWWRANVPSLVTTELALREIYIKSLDATALIEHTVPAAGTDIGTRLSGALPGNNSLCVSLRTGFTGRSSRGRWYWQGLTEDVVTNNNVAGGHAADIVDALVALETAIDTGTRRWVVVSFITNNAPRTTPAVFVIVSQVVVDTVVDSQRRRLPGRGS